MHDAKDYNYVIWLLARRSYHSVQLREKLKKRGVSPQGIDAIIDRLLENRYIDDEAYLGSYIRDQLMRKPQGSLMIRKRLSQKGIRGEAVDRELAKLGSQEHELATQALQKKIKLEKYDEKTLTHKDRQKLYRFLAGRGFKGRTVQAVIKETLT